MKPRFVVIIVCVIAVVRLLAAAGVSSARQTVLDHFVYLPIVAKLPCEDLTVSAYIMAEKPVVRVGDVFTVTVAVVSDGCADAFDITPWAGASFTSPLVAQDIAQPPDIHAGEYTQAVFTFQAISPGVDNLLGGAYFNYKHSPRGWTEYIYTSSIQIRILP
jgi:hypothetical protein